MKAWKYSFALLVLVAIAIWQAVFSVSDERLHIIACDVGQGDAILIVYGETQILIDGGPPNGKVLSCLSRHMPYYDRTIEIVLLTHPQLDHFGGLIEVFERYKVETFLANSLEASSKEYQVLKDKVKRSEARIINPTSGMDVSIGLLHLDIVHPSSDFVAGNMDTTERLVVPNVLGAYTSKKDPNDFSIVAILRLGEFDALFTGDIGPKVSDEVIKSGKMRKVEYIKIPHHGSKNGLTENLLNISNPEVAVISVGKNQWGHPHEEVVKMLSDRGIKTFRTDEMGDVEVVTDGESMWFGN